MSLFFLGTHGHILETYQSLLDHNVYEGKGISKECLKKEGEVRVKLLRGSRRSREEEGKVNFTCSC